MVFLSPLVGRAEEMPDQHPLRLGVQQFAPGGQRWSFRPLYIDGSTEPKLGDSMTSSCALKMRAASLSLFAHLNQIGTASRWNFSRSSTGRRLICVPAFSNFTHASMSAF